MVLIKSGRNGCLQRIEVTLLEEKEWEINIIVPAHTKCQGFTLYGAKMWNQLPVEIRELKNPDKFKDAVKRYIWDNIPSY